MSWNRRVLLYLGLLFAVGPLACHAGVKVFGGTQPVQWLVYAVAPQSLCALNFAYTNTQKAFLEPGFCSQPVVGGWNGGGLNLEVLLAIKPDVVVLEESTRRNPVAEENLQKAGIRLQKVSLQSLDEYPSAFEQTGGLCGDPNRGKMLSAECRKILNDVRSVIPAGEISARPSVYYAGGADGLETVGGEKGHAQVIGYAGGRNIFPAEGMKKGRFQVSPEQIMAADPDVILVRDGDLFRNIFRDAKWSALKAVRNHRVYRIPGMPVNWFDQPPSCMQILAARWLSEKLYPGRNSDFNAFVGRFYRIFLQIELSAERRQLLENAAVKGM